MEEIVLGPYPPLLSFMLGKVSKLYKIENNSILENKTRNLMDTHWRGASVCLSSNQSPACLPSKPMRGQYLMEAIVQGPYPLLSVSWQETCIIPGFWKTWIFYKVSENGKNLICLICLSLGIGQKLKIENPIIFWDFWFKWSECTFIIETPNCDSIDLSEVSALSL